MPCPIVKTAFIQKNDPVLRCGALWPLAGMVPASIGLARALTRIGVDELRWQMVADPDSPLSIQATLGTSGWAEQTVSYYFWSNILLLLLWVLDGKHVCLDICLRLGHKSWRGAVCHLAQYVHMQACGESYH